MPDSNGVAQQQIGFLVDIQQAQSGGGIIRVGKFCVMPTLWRADVHAFVGGEGGVRNPLLLRHHYHQPADKGEQPTGESGKFKNQNRLRLRLASSRHVDDGEYVAAAPINAILLGLLGYLFCVLLL